MDSHAPLALDEEQQPAHDLRARVRAVLERRKLTDSVSAEQAAVSWEQDKFVARARALFYTRMMFLTLGLLILAVPAWSVYFSLDGPLAFVGYFAMLLYSVANFVVIDHPKAGRWVTYVTLCFDLVIMVVLIVKPEGGGLQNPLLATQLLFTTLFAILYPKPLAILPPLLALPITTRLDLLLDRNVTAIDLLTLLWYSALNFIIVYVVVYLNEREAAAHREVVALQGDLKELAVVEERNRLAREIHDGLGASLSSMIIQSEYILGMAGQDTSLRAEISELKATAEESIEELRRNLRMMREDFELSQGLEDYVKTFGERTQRGIQFSRSGLARKLSPDAQLALFRILQECLSNAVKHAEAQQIQVRLEFAADRVHLGVRDDGKGFDPKKTPRGHYGLLNMRERAMKLGGDLVVDSAPGAGTQISFSLPCPPAI
jgi:signal transduction histidine kinase